MLRRTLPDGVTNIKTIFEYGVLPNITGTNGVNDFSDQCMEDTTRILKRLDKKELVIPL